MYVYISMLRPTISTYQCSCLGKLRNAIFTNESLLTDSHEYLTWKTNRHKQRTKKNTNNAESAETGNKPTCSACKASWNSGNRFSYSDGSARESAAFLLILPKSSFHNLTILAKMKKKALLLIQSFKQRYKFNMPLINKQHYRTTYELKRACKTWIRLLK